MADLKRLHVPRGALLPAAVALHRHWRRLPAVVVAAVVVAHPGRTDGRLAVHWHCSRLPAVVVAAAVAACPGCTGPPAESPVAVVSAASRDLTLAAVVEPW